VLPYLQQLSAKGHRFWLVSCEKPGTADRAWESVRNICAEAGISWHPLHYHKQPPVLSTIWDLMAMKRSAARLQRTVGFDLVHCRSYVPALIGLGMKRRDGIRFLFDMRGFWVEERVEGGLWNLGNPLFRAVYNYFKARERELLSEADHIISLTEAGRSVIEGWQSPASPGPPISVIPCCVDFASFPPVGQGGRARARGLLEIPSNARVACYLGSIGTWYMLDEMLDFFRAQRARDPGAIFLLITRDDPAAIIAAAKAKGIPPGSLRIRGATREEVPRLAAAADYALFFIKPVSSKVASSPTKMGEFMSLELPMVTNGNVGDVERIMAESGAGVVVNRFDSSAYADAIDQIQTAGFDMSRWRQAAQRWFSLERGTETYDSVYRSLARREVG
jgi:glycosyltransferase involved in cell wall biosynthesis